jgi:agmatine deiminase
MAKRIVGTTPRQDGYRMPAEFEPQQGVWMLWPERNDNWRDGGKPAQKTFADVAKAIARFEKVTVGASVRQYQNARAKLPENIRVVELESDDAWVRDCGPTFLVNDKGGLRAVDWEFNAWGGLVDGLYFPWDKDDQIARKICEIADVDSYRTEGFVLEGGSIHVDGEGTVLTTEMCLLSEGRNPDKSKEEIEQMLREYLGCEKVLWIKDGIDPDETVHLDGGQEPSVLRAGAGGVQIPERGDGRQGTQIKGPQALPDEKAVLTRGRGYHRRRGGHHPA